MADLSEANILENLHQVIARPRLFDHTTVCARLPFKTAGILMPRNSFTSGRNAPIGLADASSTSLRQLLVAVQAASGIVFLSDTLHQYQSVKHFATALDTELANASDCRRRSTTPTSVILGPHETTRSRTSALTLCLPRKTQMAELYANALAAIVLHHPAEEGVDFSKKSARDKRPTTSAVRFGLVAGEADVAEVLAAWESTSSDWTQGPCLMVHYIEGSKQHNCLFGLSAAGVADLEAAVCEIRSVCTAAQRQAGGVLTFPSCLIDTRTQISSRVSLTDAFAQLQQDVQQDVHNMCFPATESTTPRSIKQFFIPGGSLHKMFVRVVRALPHKPFVPDDPNHSVGILLTGEELGANDWNASAMRAFMMRARAAVPPNSIGEWPVYGLSPPIEEELVASPCVLWFAAEKRYVGDSISTYGVRQSLGEHTTPYGDSCIDCLRTRFQPLRELLESGFMVLPCSRESVVSRPTISMNFDRGINEQSLHDQLAKLHTVFNQFMSSRLDEAISSSARGPSALVHCPSQASEMSIDCNDGGGEAGGGNDGGGGEAGGGDVEDPEQAAIMALMQVPPGTPYTTVQDVYNAMGQHNDVFSLHMRSYHRFLTSALSLGRGAYTMKRLLDETADSLDASLLAKRNKHSSQADGEVADVTGATDVDHAPIHAASATSMDSNLFHLFDTEDSRTAMFETLGLALLCSVSLPKAPNAPSVAELQDKLTEHGLVCASNASQRYFQDWVDVLRTLVASDASDASGASGASGANVLRQVGIHTSVLAKKWKAPKLLNLERQTESLGVSELLQKQPSPETAHRHLYWFSKTEDTLPWSLCIYGSTGRQ